MNEPPASPHPTASFLKLEGVHKAYRIGERSIQVLRGVSLRMERGELLAIQGASGAGKSTLLHLLGGLDTADAGEIWLGGQCLSAMNPNLLGQVRNRQVGFVFQAYHLFPELDALENVALPARIDRRNSREVIETARTLLRRVGLGDRVEHKPYELSGGEQQRVALARALINEPALVLADEPTGNLDSHTGQEIFDLLRSIQQERKSTLIVATHDNRIAAQIPRVLQLEDGLVVNG